MQYKTFGELIKYLRHKANRTLQEVADFTDVSLAVVRNWESDTTQFPGELGLLKKLSKILKVNPDVLASKFVLMIPENILQIMENSAIVKNSRTVIERKGYEIEIKVRRKL